MMPRVERRVGSIWMLGCSSIGQMFMCSKRFEHILDYLYDDTRLIQLNLVASVRYNAVPSIARCLRKGEVQFGGERTGDLTHRGTCCFKGTKEMQNPNGRTPRALREFRCS